MSSMDTILNMFVFRIEEGDIKYSRVQMDSVRSLPTENDLFVVIVLLFVFITTLFSRGTVIFQDNLSLDILA